MGGICQKIRASAKGQKMKKYKLLKFGQCYINREGDFVIALLGGEKKKGYRFAGSHAHPYVVLGTFQLLSRIVPNDGNWIEITPYGFNVASHYHSQGYVMRLSDKPGEPPVITKYVSPASS
jgi:hypothetical protein